METIFTVDYKNVDMFMPSLTYGSTFVAYENEKTRQKMLENIYITNRYVKADALEEFEGISVQTGEKIPGTYRILNRVRGLDIPELTEDDYNLRINVKKAQDLRAKVTFNLDYNLFEFAAKLAYSHGVKFVKEASFQYFTGEAKTKSISKQIEDAYKAGLPSISFSSFDVSVPTVRCYASNLSSTYGKKFKCKFTDGKVTIHFKEPNLREIAEEKVLKSFLELEEHSSIQYAIKAFEKILKKYEYYKNQKDSYDPSKELISDDQEESEDEEQEEQDGNDF